MAENIQVLRIEISNTGTTSKETISAGALVAPAGAISKSKSKSFKEQYQELTVFGGKGETPNEKKLQRAVGYNVLKFSVSRDSYFTRVKSPIKNRITGVMEGMRIIGSNINYDPLKKYGPKAVTGALAAYSLYSQTQVTKYNLSGASHAAQIQQRRMQSASFGTGLALSLATGQYWATALMLAGRAWQLSQQNRQEIYQIRSSQIISSVMQERLIKDTIQRRF